MNRLFSLKQKISDAYFTAIGGTKGLQTLGMLGSLFTVLFLNVVSAQKVGDTLPDFSVTDTQGNIVTPADFAGKPLLLNFWATWCPPCQEELPLFQSAAEAVPELQVFLVNTGETLEQAKEYLEQSNLTLPSAVNSDKGEDTLDITKRFRVRGMPTTFFINSDGTIQSIYVGQISEVTLIERLAEIGVTWQP